MLAAKTWPLIRGLRTALRRLYFQCLFQEPVVIGAADAHFYNSLHSSKKLLWLCLIMLSGFSHSSFWFALRNVTSADLDWPSEGFCTLGGFSIGLGCLFLRDALLDYASLPKTHTCLGQKWSSLELFDCFPLLFCDQLFPQGRLWWLFFPLYLFCITSLWWILSPWAMTICLFSSLPHPKPFYPLLYQLRSLLECGFGVPS